MNKNLALFACCMLFASCQQSTDGEALATGQAAKDSGEAAYLAYCASCHDRAVYKAPSRLFISMMGARNVLSTMNDGLMSAQAASLDESERKAIAKFLTGQDPDALPPDLEPASCDAQHGFDATRPPTSLGWGVDHANTRLQPAASAGLDADQLGLLEVKWAFAYPNAIKARSQPLVAGGAVYFGGPDGTVRALDAETGCLRWSFHATAEVRTSPVISPWLATDENPEPTVYFADLLARVYALDARTGELRWMTKVDDHPDATVTGTVALAGNGLYVPVSSLEVVSAGNPKYECCTFRGSVVALDAATGRVNWKSYVIDNAPSESGKTVAGTRTLGPSGAPIWNSPTIDLARNRLYVGTGENYSSPADGNSDAIMAFDLDDGEKLWVSQQTENDAWNVACLIEGVEDHSNCPVENGPDYDFGASVILVTLEDGRNVVVGGQKSGYVMAVDPDSGETLWKTKVGRGGVQGGVHFGMAAEGPRVYVPINDMYYKVDDLLYDEDDSPVPGLYAINANDGAIEWSAPAPDTCGGLQFCDPGISQAISAIPGAVIAGHLDGHLRVYAADSGKILWELNSLRDFETVSGEIARGGSFSGGGAAIADGMIYINSGYGMYNHMPGNVLLAIGVAEPES